MHAVLAYVAISAWTPSSVRQADPTKRVYRDFVKESFMVDQLMNFCCAMGTPVGVATGFGYPPALGFACTEEGVDRLWVQFSKIERVRFVANGTGPWTIEPDGPQYSWPSAARHGGDKFRDVQMPADLAHEVRRRLSPPGVGPADFAVKSMRCYVRPYWGSDLSRSTLVSGSAQVKDHGEDQTVKMWFLLPAKYSVEK